LGDLVKVSPVKNVYDSVVVDAQTGDRLDYRVEELKNHGIEENKTEK
jgi:hypothetical protein